MRTRTLIETFYWRDHGYDPRWYDNPKWAKYANDEYLEDLDEFADDCEIAGMEPYPRHRKEALKPKDRRKMKAAYKFGVRANTRVRALVDFINYKRQNKYR